MRKLILIGGGGHCHSCIDVIEQEGKYSIHGILDSSLEVNSEVLGYTVLGSDDQIERLAKENYYFLITIGQIKSPTLRIKIASLVTKAGGQFATIISPRSYIAKNVSIEEGTIIMHNSVINTNACLGKHCIINTGSLIEHDARVEDYCHISTMAVVNGSSIISRESFLGSNSTVHDRLTVPPNSVIGAGKIFSIKDQNE